jgi:hypothetical protein
MELKENELKQRIDRIPGCRGIGDIFSCIGIKTSKTLGKLSNTDYKDAKAWIPEKRIEHRHTDFSDPTRYGIGSFSNIDELREQCKREVTMARCELANNTFRRSRSAPPAKEILPSSMEFPAVQPMEPPNPAPADDMSPEVRLDSMKYYWQEAEVDAVKLLGDAICIPPEDLQDCIVHARRLIQECTEQPHTVPYGAMAAEALGCVRHVLVALGGEKLDRNGYCKPLMDAENKVRDVMVWQCQLIVGEEGFSNRDRFMEQLYEIVREAARSLNGSEAANLGRTALPFLLGAQEKGNFESQVMHSHTAEIKSRFRNTFPSNCQRTAARRGRARNRKGYEVPWRIDFNKDSNNDSNNKDSNNESNDDSTNDFLNFLV